MQTNFTLTREDFSRFQTLLAKRFKRRVPLFSGAFLLQVTCWMFVGMAGAGLFQLIEQEPKMAGSLRILGVFLALALVAMLAVGPIQRAILRKYMLLPNGAFLSPQTLSISDAGLLMETARGRSELVWSGVLDVEQDDRNYYLLVDAMQAVIVPKASVQSFQVEFERRLSLLKNAA